MSTKTRTSYYANIVESAVPRVTVGLADRAGIPQRVGALALTDDRELGVCIPTTMTILTPDALRRMADRIEEWEANNQKNGA